jgi:hypothetical protein
VASGRWLCWIDAYSKKQQKRPSASWDAVHRCCGGMPVLEEQTPVLLYGRQVFKGVEK